jgi:hypothetical protein
MSGFFVPRWPLIHPDDRPSAICRFVLQANGGTAMLDLINSHGAIFLDAPVQGKRIVWENLQEMDSGNH